MLLFNHFLYLLSGLSEGWNKAKTGPGPKQEEILSQHHRWVASIQKCEYSERVLLDASRLSMKIYLSFICS